MFYVSVETKVVNQNILNLRENCAFFTFRRSGKKSIRTNNQIIKKKDFNHGFQYRHIVSYQTIVISKYPSLGF